MTPDKYVIDCPVCEDEDLVIDLYHDAEYECCKCGAVFDVEVIQEPLTPALFDIELMTTVH